MYRFIFNRVKKIIPRISDTELIALRTGNTNLDRQIFNGHVSLPNKIDLSEDKFPKDKINNLLDTYKNSQVFPSRKTPLILRDLSENGFFSFLIPEKYGGTKLSVTEMSAVLTNISSKNVPLGVTVMVPNSLGPSELLINYGTNQQKTKYLPLLANGNFIPCFGLTGPNNGSDALGSIDTGTVKKDSNNEIYIDVTLNKRYITLAPIANLVGLAINIEDPNNILPNNKLGTTVFLLEKSHPNLKLETHHNPLDIGFPNGTIKGNIKLSLDQIIGGEEKLGEGWKMLMECLAAGRGICLPATANASSKVCTYGIFNYIKHRRQFNIPLIKMEGVSNKFVDMLYNTWLINTSIAMTNTILDQGNKPAVISAIMKEQTTERSRVVINHAVDIHAGSAICLGENNFINKFYKSIPVGITVEGSNTLTKNLIIFGQGLNKSHPHIYDIFNSIKDDDIEAFKFNFNKIIKHSLNLYGKSFSVKNNLEQQTIDFACLSNFIALLGGQIKKNQSISADMANILSNLYLAYSVKWYHKHFSTSEILTKYCIERLLRENDLLFNRVIDNYEGPRFLVNHIKRKIISEDYNDNRNLLHEIISNEEIINVIKENVYIDETLEDLENLNNYPIDSKEYRELLKKVVDVGEYENPVNKPYNIV